MQTQREIRKLVEIASGHGYYSVGNFGFPIEENLKTFIKAVVKLRKMKLVSESPVLNNIEKVFNRESCNVLDRTKSDLEETKKSLSRSSKNDPGCQILVGMIENLLAQIRNKEKTKPFPSSLIDSIIDEVMLKEGQEQYGGPHCQDRN